MSSTSQVELSSSGSLSSGSLLDIYRDASVFVDPIVAAIWPSHPLSHMYLLKS